LLTAIAAAYSTAGIITYDAALSGANEAPPTGSPGVGFAIVTVDTILNTMEVNVTFSGLTSGNTAAHIHCCVAPGGNAGVATITPTFTGFPSGTTAGTYDHLFDLTSSDTYNPAFITLEGNLANAESALLAGLAGDMTYLNIHTTENLGGEIRGFLVTTPEPQTWLLALAGLGLLWVARRKLV
jgi:MYXO-CTERM domain-containing protein